MSGRAEVTIVPKPWGHEKIWARTDRYVGKILHINAGQALSVQYHERKDETVYLLSGELRYWVSLDQAEGQEVRAEGRAPRAEGRQLQGRGLRAEGRVLVHHHRAEGPHVRLQ